MNWPTPAGADTFAPIEDRENHRLEVFLDEDGQVSDVQVDGESVWPTWFKVEWKGTGDLSAKVQGLKLATRFGDEIVFRATMPAARGRKAAR